LFNLKDSNKSNQMFEIRKCRGGDFDEVIPLLRQLWADKTVDPTLLRPIFDRGLASPSKTYLVARNKDHVIGFGSLTLKDDLWPEGHVAYIDELVVHSEYRSQGIGAQLLERLISTARLKGCYKIELTSAFYRKDSQRFYERHGFTCRAYVFSKVL
jgi:glucosamine-phosphate N-acetyltransferase